MISRLERDLAAKVGSVFAERCGWRVISVSQAESWPGGRTPTLRQNDSVHALLLEELLRLARLFRPAELMISLPHSYTLLTGEPQGKGFGIGAFEPGALPELWILGWELPF